MAIKVKDILEQTVVYLNEYSADMQDQTFAEETFGAEARTDLLAHIDAAARMVAQVAPSHLQEPVTNDSYDLTLTERPDGRLHGTAVLPSRYMRLVYLMSEHLFRPITVLLPSVHPTYHMQFCPVAGLGAGSYAPIGYQVDGTIDVHSFDDNVNVNDNGNDNGNGDDNDNVNDNVNVNDNGNDNKVTVTICYLELPNVTGTGDSAEYSTLKEELRDVIAMQAAALYLAMDNAEKAAEATQIATTMLKGLAQES